MQKNGSWFVFLSALILSTSISLGALILSVVKRGDVGGPNWVRGADSGVFLYGGQRLLEGQVPYRDFWDHKGPLIYVIDALGLAVGRGSTWGVFALEVLVLSIGGLLAFLIVKSFAGTWIAFPCIALYVLSIEATLDRGNLTEEFAVVFVMAAFYSVVRAEGRPGFWLGVSIGLFGALAALLKVTYIATPISIAMAILILAVCAGANAAIGRMIAGGILSAGFVFGVAALYFIYHHALGDAIFANWTFQIGYVGNRGELTVLTLIIRLLGLVSSSGLGILALSGWIVACFRIVKPKNRLHRVLSLSVGIAFPLEISLSFLSGFGYPHYFMMLAPIGTVSAALFFVELMFSSKQASLGAESHVSGSKIAGVALTFALIALPIARGVELASYPPVQADYDKEQIQLVEIIRENTDSEDQILVWGSRPMLYVLSSRSAPTRFFYQSVLQNGSHMERYREEFATAIMCSPPAMIVDVGTGPLPTFKIDELETSDIDYPEVYIEIARFVEENYTHTTSVGTVRIYTFIGSEESNPVEINCDLRANGEVLMEDFSAKEMN